MATDITATPFLQQTDAITSELSFKPSQLGTFEQIHGPQQSKKRGLHQISDPITSPKRVEINRRLKFDTWPKSAQFLNNKNMMDEFLNLKIFVKAQYDQIYKLQQHTNSPQVQHEGVVTMNKLISQSNDIAESKKVI